MVSLKCPVLIESRQTPSLGSFVHTYGIKWSIAHQDAIFQRFTRNKPDLFPLKVTQTWSSMQTKLVHKVVLRNDPHKPNSCPQSNLEKVFSLQIDKAIKPFVAMMTDHKNSRSRQYNMTWGTINRAIQIGNGRKQTRIFRFAAFRSTFWGGVKRTIAQGGAELKIICHSFGKYAVKFNAKEIRFWTRADPITRIYHNFSTSSSSRLWKAKYCRRVRKQNPFYGPPNDPQRTHKDQLSDSNALQEFSTIPIFEMCPLHPSTNPKNPTIV